MDTSDTKIKSYYKCEKNTYKISKYCFNLLSNSNYIRQKNIIDHPDYISKKDEKTIDKQMKYSICKIKCHENYGTGFFCTINEYPDNKNSLSVLVTSNKILGKAEISHGSHIFLSINDESYFYRIIMDNSRLSFIDENYNITIIEIKKEDKMDVCGLELDYDSFESKSLDEFKQRTVYLIYYSDSIYSEHSFGIIKSISLDNYIIKHTCKYNTGALGCPILSLKNFKVIGVQVDDKTKNSFLGKLIKGPIQNFFSLHKLKKNYFILKTIEEIEKEEAKENAEKKRCVFFTSKNQYLNLAILCSGETVFADVEKMLYERCPEYYDEGNIFIKNGILIDKNLTVDENQCGDGLPITLLNQN